MLHGSRPWQGIPRREAPEKTERLRFISNNTEKQTLRLAGRAIENARRFAPVVYGAPHREWRESEVRFLARGIMQEDEELSDYQKSRIRVAEKLFPVGSGVMVGLPGGEYVWAFVRRYYYDTWQLMAEIELTNGEVWHLPPAFFT